MGPRAHRPTLYAVLAAAAALAALALWGSRSAPSPGDALRGGLAQALAAALGERVQLEGVQVELPGLELRVASVTFHDPGSGLQVRARGVRVLPPAAGWSVAALRPRAVEIDALQLELSLDARGHARLPAGSFGDAAGSAPWLEHVRIAQLDARVSGPDGLFVHAPGVTLDFDRRRPPAQALQLQGQGGELRFRGARLALLRATGSADPALDHWLGELEAEGELAAGLHARVVARLADTRLDAELQFDAELTPLVSGAPLEGTLSGSAQLRGALSDATLAGPLELRVKDLASAGAPLLPGESRLRGELRVSDTASSLRGTLEAGEAALQLALELRGGAIGSLSLRGESVPLATLGPLRALGVAGLAQPLSFQVTRGSPGLNWTLQARAESARVAGYSLSRLQLELTGVAGEPDSTLALQAARVQHGSMQARELRAEGTLRGEPAGRGSAALSGFAGELNLARVDLSGYLRQVMGIAELTGGFGVRLVVSGAAGSAKPSRGTLELTDLVIAQGATRIEALEPVRAVLEGARLRLQPTRLQTARSRLVLRGDANLATGPELQLDGDTDLAWLADRYPDVASARGVLQIALRLDGTWAAPQLSGSASTEAAQLRLLEQDFEALAAQLRVQGSVVHVEQATARVRDGRVRARGVLHLSGLELRAFDIGLDVGPFALSPAPGARAGLSGALRLQGTAGSERANLSGTLTLHDAGYRRALPLQGLVALSQQGLGSPAASAAGRPHFDLDLDIALEPAVQLRNNLADATLSVDPEHGLHLGGSELRPTLNGRLVLAGRLMFRSLDFFIDRAHFDFDAASGLDPDLELLATTRRGVELRLTGDREQLELALGCNAQPAAARGDDFRCQLGAGDARCASFEALVERFQCAGRR